MDPAAMAEASGFGPRLLSLEFFFRWRFLILSDRDLACPFGDAMSEAWRCVPAVLFVKVDLGLEFRLVDLRKLLLLRSVFCEGAKIIPQPGAAMLVWGTVGKTVSWEIGMFLKDGTAHISYASSRVSMHRSMR